MHKAYLRVYWKHPARMKQRNVASEDTTKQRRMSSSSSVHIVATLSSGLFVFIVPTLSPISFGLCGFASTVALKAQCSTTGQGFKPRARGRPAGSLTDTPGSAHYMTDWFLLFKCQAHFFLSSDVGKTVFMILCGIYIYFSVSNSTNSKLYQWI